MNVQKIILSIVKEKLFTKLTPKETILMKSIAASSSKTLEVEKNSNEQSVLYWKSKIGESVACPFTDNEIKFSAVEVYKTSNYSMKGNIEKNFPGDVAKAEILQAEIEEIKQIFMSYDSKIKKCFK